MTELTDLGGYLSANEYPGRGLLLGLNASGTAAIAAYFIMGRSVNSRNRVFVPDGDGLRTEAYDPALLSDPSLIIYAPVRVLGDATIITNGDQTDTVYDIMAAGGSFAQALTTRCFEPDAPNYTPRISGLLRVADGRCEYELSILKRDEAGECQRIFWRYGQPQPGAGRLIHTYAGNGEPLPSFVGEPIPVALSGDIDSLTQQLWGSLNADNRVALFVRSIDLASGAAETRVVNQHQQ